VVGALTDANQNNQIIYQGYTANNGATRARPTILVGGW